MPILKLEAEEDLKNTERDIENLDSIVEHLTSFIHESGGEDRSKFRTDLFLYRGLLQEARTLRDKIQDYLGRISEQTF